MRNYKRAPSNISSHRSDSELDSLNISTSKQTQTLEEQFNLWINTLNANLSKRLYKNVFQDISSNLKKYYSLSIHSKAIVLKIRTILKIIEMKGKKYHLTNSLNDSKSKFQLSRINQYTSMIINDIDYLIQLIEKDNDIDIIEDVIFLFASLLYTKAVIYKKMNKVITSLSLLSIIVYNLSKNMLNIITNVDTLIIINKAILLIANYLIQNKDYDNGMHLISESITFSLRALNFIIEYNEPLQDENYDKKTQRRIDKLICNIIIAYYDRGVVYENQCDILNAVNNYKQCRYLSNALLTNEKDTSLRKATRKLFNRALSYYDTINYLIDKSELYELTKKRNHSMRKLGNKYNNSLRLKKIAEGNIYHNNRYDKTLKTISSLTIPEIDMVNRYKKKKESVNDYILSNVRLLDALMSEDFKGMIKSMDKIKVCDYDESTREKIQKLVNKMHYDKTMRTKNSNASTYNNDTIFTFNNFSNTNEKSFRLSSSHKKTIFNKSQPTLYYLNRNNNNSVTTATSNLRNSKSYSLLTSSMKRSKQTTSRNQSAKTKKVPQYKINEDLFIESYQNKKKYLNELNEKELKFQRELLRLKTKENINDIVNNDVDVDNIKQDAKLLYERLVSLIDERKEDVNKKLSPEEIGEMRRSTMVRNSVIKSQNEKAFRISIMDENKKNEERVVYCDDEDMIAQLSDRGEVEKRNKEMIEKLNDKIYMIKQKQKDHHRSNSVINI